MVNLIGKISKELGLKEFQVHNSVQLMFDEECTIPFVARYRKEMTGTLDEVAIRAIRDRFHYLNELRLKLEERYKERMTWTCEHDLRRAYEGFTFSHASIMFNVLERIPAVERLVQVGIRDFCEAEWNYAKAQGQRARIFLDADLQHRRHLGRPWAKSAQEIVAALPQEVWISFDIDGLDPRFCPHTGTPVPGGLDFAEANHLIAAVARSGRKIIGFDLNEVSPDPTGRSEWDANVGARLLYKLTAWTLVSQGLRKPRHA